LDAVFFHPLLWNFRLHQITLFLVYCRLCKRSRVWMWSVVGFFFFFGLRVPFLFYPGRGDRCACNSLRHCWKAQQERLYHQPALFWIDLIHLVSLVMMRHNLIDLLHRAHRHHYHVDE